MPFGTEVSLGPGDIVLDGDPAPRKKGHSSPSPILAHVCYGQTAGWIKMPLGTEVYLGPRHIVLDGGPAHPPKSHSSPLVFGPCLLWPNGRQSQLLLGTC